MKKTARTADDRLISGKLRDKAGRRNATHTTVTVDGTPYAWSPRHSWQVHGKGLQVISFSVALNPSRTRELILDLVMKVDLVKGPPSDARVQEALAGGIRMALEGGWDPESRGRAFRYEVVDA